ncbi:uncharacterized protein ZBAI_08126 [Zygosaccharomyces bailii ISA1307]|nr:uncharacterized protein ZBAI_08126 [Zygosaccharomyces bailii ISA1307]
MIQPSYGLKTVYNVSLQMKDSKNWVKKHSWNLMPQELFLCISCMCSASETESMPFFQSIQWQLIAQFLVEAIVRLHPILSNRISYHVIERNLHHGHDTAFAARQTTN